MYLANHANQRAKTKRISVETIQLNQNIATKTINQDNRYRIFSEIFFLSWNPILSKILPKIADQIYPHISTKNLHQPELVSNQLQSEFTSKETILHHVIRAKNACQNSCINVTSKLIG